MKPALILLAVAHLFFQNAEGQIKQVPVKKAAIKNITPISPELAKDMLFHYHQQRVMAIIGHRAINHNIKPTNDNGEAMDSKSMWLSKSDLETLRNRVTGTQGGDCIRIYFGVYPDMKNTDVLPSGTTKDEIRNRLTLVFVPTKTDGHVHADVFDPNAEKFSKKSMAFSILGIDNHGGICSPPSSGCPGATLAAASLLGTWTPSRSY